MSPLGVRARRASPLLLTGALGLLSGCSLFHSSTSTTTTLPATTATTPKTPSVCAAALLEVSATTGGSAAGSAYERFTLTNTGPTACALEGYPELSFFAPSAAGGAGAGSKIALGVDHGGPAPALEVLAPAKTSEFLLFFSDVPVGGAGCTTVASVELRPPGGTEVVTAPVTFSPCGPVVKVYPYAVPGSENP
jgi:hypothetical protein